MLEQLLKQDLHESELKVGGLILDPKATLISEVTRICEQRPKDLFVLNPDVMQAEGKAVNLLDCGVEMDELARLLTMAACGAGVKASDPFWLAELKNLLSAALFLMNWLENTVVTVKRLVELLLVLIWTDIIRF